MTYSITHVQVHVKHDPRTIGALMASPVSRMSFIRCSMFSSSEWCEKTVVKRMNNHGYDEGILICCLNDVKRTAQCLNLVCCLQLVMSSA